MTSGNCPVSHHGSVNRRITECFTEDTTESIAESRKKDDLE